MRFCMYTSRKIWLRLLYALVFLLPSSAMGQHPNVLADPEPRILFMGFGDSSLNFEARVYIGTIDHYLSTVDEITNAIDQGFRKAGIEIAFPQHDIHVRSIHAALPMTDERRTDAGSDALGKTAGPASPHDERTGDDLEPNLH